MALRRSFRVGRAGSGGSLGLTNGGTLAGPDTKDILGLAASTSAVFLGLPTFLGLTTEMVT